MRACRAARQEPRTPPGAAWIAGRVLREHLLPLAWARAEETPNHSVRRARVHSPPEAPRDHPRRRRARRPPAAVLTADRLLAHWQGHRRLTRKLVEAFPEDQLFTFSVGGMRPFGGLALELLSMAEPTARGVATGEWATSFDDKPTTKAEILRRWDESTRAIDELWATIPPERFGEHMVAFGQYPGLGIDLLLYIIDNEVHHRGQGYVYLRALGVAPPAFWER
jgi:uncharacterized damage-inducible protein DinB